MATPMMICIRNSKQGFQKSIYIANVTYDYMLFFAALYKMYPEISVICAWRRYSQKPKFSGFYILSNGILKSQETDFGPKFSWYILSWKVHAIPLSKTWDNSVSKWLLASKGGYPPCHPQIQTQERVLKLRHYPMSHPDIISTCIFAYLGLSRTCGVGWSCSLTGRRRSGDQSVVSTPGQAGTSQHQTAAGIQPTRYTVQK